jgi:hypothetical protein
MRTRWRREEPLLEQLIDERRAETLADLFGILLAAGAVVVQLLVDGALFRCTMPQRLQLALGIEGFAVGIDQVALQATDHHLTQLLFVGEDVSGETLVVQQLQQRGEGFGVAVVRRGCQKQPMLEVRTDRADEARPLALQRVVRTGGGGDVVRFVDDQQSNLRGWPVCTGRTSRMARKSFTTFDPVHRRDEARMRCPRVGVDAALAPQLLDVCGVDHAELEAELFQHLDAPLFLQRCGQMIRTVRARCRSSISWMTRPASMVLPRPTSSAMSRLTRAMSMARTSGSSWKSSMLTPLRNGACRNPRSALVAAPQRTASRKASSMSNHPGL